MNPSVDLKLIKMKMPVTPLNAIYENEEENTETIKNISGRKEQCIINSPNNPSKPSSLRFNVQLFPNKNKGISVQSHMMKRFDDPVFNLKNSSKNEVNHSRNIQNETNQTNTCLSLNTKDSLVIISNKYICSNKNDRQVSYKEVFNYFLSYYLQFNVSNAIKVKRNNSKGKSNNALCCLRYFLIKHMSKYKLNKELKSDRSLLLFLSDIPFDIDDELHWKMTQTIYYAIKDATSFNKNGNTHNDNLPIQRKGSEWNCLFETNRPEFSIKQGGIYIIIQVLFLIEKHPDYFKELNQLFSNEQTNKNCIFDFLSSITALCLEYVNNNELNVYFNQKQNVIETLLDFYIGCIYQTQIYLAKEPIASFSYSLVQTALNKTKHDALKNPSSILWRCKQFKESFPEEANSNSLFKSFAE